MFFNNRTQIEELLWTHRDNIRVADSLEKILIDSKVVEKIQQAPSGKSDKGENPISAGDIRGTYFIIAGSFTNPENAKLFAGKYHSLGYKTSIISRTDRYGKKTELVSVNTFNSFNEAARYLKEFQSKFDTEAWIISKK
jgi:hypothetical protein